MKEELITAFEKSLHSVTEKIPDFFLAVVVLIVFYFIASRSSKYVRFLIEEKTGDKLFSTFAGRLSKFTIITIGILISMNILGFALMAGGIITGASVSAVILGFAFKNIGENFLSGIILAFKRPFKIGDLIQINNMQGFITSIDLRTTNIKTADGEDIFIPNSMMIINPLINYTFDTKRRFSFVIQIDYSYDTSKVKGLLMEALSEINEILTIPKPFVVIDQLISNVSLKVFYWIDTGLTDRNTQDIKSEIIEKSLNSLNKNGFFLSEAAQIRLTNDLFNVKIENGKS